MCRINPRVEHCDLDGRCTRQRGSVKPTDRPQSPLTIHHGIRRACFGSGLCKPAGGNAMDIPDAPYARQLFLCFCEIDFWREAEEVNPTQILILGLPDAYSEGNGAQVSLGGPRSAPFCAGENRDYLAHKLPSLEMLQRLLDCRWEPKGPNCGSSCPSEIRHIGYDVLLNPDDKEPWHKCRTFKSMNRWFPRNPIAPDHFGFSSLSQ